MATSSGLSDAACTRTSSSSGRRSVGTGKSSLTTSSVNSPYRRMWAARIVGVRFVRSVLDQRRQPRQSRW
jgi:hypothetical protein